MSPGGGRLEFPLLEPTNVPMRLIRSYWQASAGITRSLLIYWRPGRQASLRTLYEPYVPRGGLVFDVGAHLGDRTRAFADLGARVIAFEPQARVHQWLQRLVGSRPSVVLRREAVGPKEGEALLAVSRRTPTLSTLSDRWKNEIGLRNPSFRHAAWEDSVRVPVVTLDGLIAQYGLPDFCKIDVEGFEAEVLQGLGQPIPALSFEFVSGTLDLAQDCVRRISALGRYEFNAIRGEQRRYLFLDWQVETAMLQWLEDGADGISSGDIYARLVP